MCPRRMSPEARRTQLLDTAEELFGRGAFDDLSMDDIAAHAGVTRALVYHYFPTKADLFAAVWFRAHESLRATADLAEAETIRDGLVTALTAYLDFFERNLALIVVANLSSIAATPVVREPINANFRTLCTTVLDAAGTSGRSRVLAETAFMGWIAFVRDTTLAALVNGSVTPSENLAMCVTALDATVGVYADLGAAPPASAARVD